MPPEDKKWSGVESKDDRLKAHPLRCLTAKGSDAAVTPGSHNVKHKPGVVFFYIASNQLRM